MQEALVAAATTWPADGQPDNPLGWLDPGGVPAAWSTQYRRDDARRRREDLAASWSIDPPRARVRRTTTR